MTTINAAVAGASGYAGGEIIRLLSEHPSVRVGALTAAGSAGSRLGEHHPHLAALADRVLQPTGSEQLAGHDVVFLALPHGESGPVAAALDTGTIAIDCGADFRLEDPAAWQKYYGGEHAGTWTYGLPELIRGNGRQRDELSDVSQIAVPGCNVTAVTLAIQPAISSRLVASTDIVAVLANGYSGAGKAMKPHLMAAEGLGAATAYSVGGTHRHIPEIIQNLRCFGAGDVTVSFTPTLVPMSRGILATVTAPLAPGADNAALRRAYDSVYDNEPFIRVLRDGQQPTTGAVLGSNLAMLQLATDDDAGRLVVTCAIDNLVKGTAGAAVQSMNLAVGREESTGLPMSGVKP